MTNSRNARTYRSACGLLIGMSVLAFSGTVSGRQSTPAPPPPIKPARPVYVLPPSDVRYQQVVQQQKARDQLQQSQLEQQLHSGVSSNAHRPAAIDSNTPQYDQAEQARLDRDRARQQDLLDQYRQAPVLPRVVPKELPKPAQDKGNR